MKAMNNWHLCGREHIQTNCAKDTIRARFGIAEPAKFDGNDYYFNPIHRSRNENEANREVGYFWSSLYHRPVVKNISNMVEYLYQSKGLSFVYQHHIKLAVEIGMELCDQCEANRSVVELALWLHDLATLQRGDKHNHHIIGAGYAKELLGMFGCEDSVTEHVSDCILTHRGSKRLTQKTIEAKIVASADGMANIKCAPLLFYFVYKLKGLDFIHGLEKIQLKVEQSHDKIFEPFKQNIKEEYQEWQEVFSF